MCGMTKRVWGLLAAAVVLVLVLAACEGDGESRAAELDRSVQQQSFDRLQAAEPAHVMTNPVTRRTINRWIDTWNVPGQLAFVYFREGGVTTEYVVLDGPPVSYCTALTQTWQFVDNPNDETDDHNWNVPAPGIDGVYYSGGDCNVRYGFDAGTGRYLEWSVGNGLNYKLSTTPQPQFAEAKPAGDTTIEQIEVDADGVAKVVR